jgi:hypothetical protein
MFDAGWLSLVGLGVQLAGLGLLSWDLLKTKDADIGAAPFREALSEIESQSRVDLATSHGAADLTRATRSFLQLSAWENEFRADPTGFAQRPREQGRTELLPFLEGKEPISLTQYAAEQFADAEKKLVDEATIERGLDLIMEVRRRLIMSYQTDHARAVGFRRVAVAGVLLTAIGSVAQFIDLIA